MKKPIWSQKSRVIQELTILFPQERGSIYSLAAASGSQLGQDLFAIAANRFAGALSFIEVGVGNGIEISNTLLMERRLSWNGILVEPNPVYAKSIEAQRPTSKLARIACGADEGSVSLKLAGLFSTTEKRKIMRHSWRYFFSPEIECPRRSLEAIMKESGLGNQNVDYLSVDTEGSEVGVLMGIDFSKRTFGAITVEHNFDPKKKATISGILSEVGYRQVLTEYSSWESWWVPSSNEDFG